MNKSITNNAKILINIAQEDFLFSPDEDQNPRFVQAFLLQSCIVEGLSKEFTNDLNKQNRIKGMKEPRAFYQACREIRVANGISKNDFDKLSNYIDFRNDLVHKLLKKDDMKLLENEINEKYSDGLDIINILLR